MFLQFIMNPLNPVINIIVEIEIYPPAKGIVLAPGAEGLFCAKEMQLPLQLSKQDM